MKVLSIVLLGIISIPTGASADAPVDDCLPGFRVVRPQSEKVRPLSVMSGGTHFPAEVLRVLGKHQHWQTITYSSQRAAEIPYFQVSDQKKWALLYQKNSLVGLQETTSLSIRPVDSGALQWNSESVDFSQRIDMARFYFLGFQDSGLDKTIRVLDENRFELLSSDGVYHVVFFPEVSSPIISSVVSPAVGVWTAPLGPSKQATLDILHLKKTDLAYLHHNLQKSQPVYVDSSFPKRHLRGLQAALYKWNRALGKKFFIQQKSSGVLDWSDCLSTSRLCIRWNGAETIPWTGVGGSASFTFDPETGTIIGGIISFMNSAQEGNLQDTPTPVVDVFRNAKFGLDWIAQTYLQRDLFINLRHPMPELLVENILLHELGHFNGFSHNFSGSIPGDARRISESIMDYFPFSAVRSNSLGNFDLQNLKAIYFGKIPNQSYRFCSDNDSVHGVAECNPFDVGNAADWFVTLAEASTERVFAISPGSGKPILFHLGQFLTASGAASESDRAKVIQYLCDAYPKQRQKITDALFKEQNIRLGCVASL